MSPFPSADFQEIRCTYLCSPPSASSSQLFRHPFEASNSQRCPSLLFNDVKGVSNAAISLTDSAIDQLRCLEVRISKSSEPIKLYKPTEA